MTSITFAFIALRHLKFCNPNQSPLMDHIVLSKFGKTKTVRFLKVLGDKFWFKAYSYIKWYFERYQFPLIIWILFGNFWKNSGYFLFQHLVALVELTHHKIGITRTAQVVPSVFGLRLQTKMSNVKLTAASYEIKLFLKKGQTRPLFVYFHMTNIAQIL